MDFVALGKSNLLVSRTAFGAMSLDCKEINDAPDAEEKACAIVHQAYTGGINFFDTSHNKTVCEKRLGAALHGIRQNVILATKSSAQSVKELRCDLKESLIALESDYIDLFQIENPLFVPVKGGPDGIYNELLNLKAQGIIRHIGMATDDIDIAREACESGLYETIQAPFNILSEKPTRELVELCAKKDVGFIAMQPLNGGIVSDITLAFGFLTQFENVVPLWGAHTQEELHELLYVNDHPPVIDDNFKAEVEKIRMFFN